MRIPFVHHLVHSIKILLVTSLVVLLELEAFIVNV